MLEIHNSDYNFNQIEEKMQKKKHTPGEIHNHNCKNHWEHVIEQYRTITNLTKLKFDVLSHS